MKYLRCGGIFSDRFIADLQSFTAECVGKRTLNIGQYLMRLGQTLEVGGLLF